VRSRLFRARTALLEMLDPPEASAKARRRGRPSAEAVLGPVLAAKLPAALTPEIVPELTPELPPALAPVSP
jgi:hypothetical protein